MAELLTRKGQVSVAPGAPTTFDPERRTVELIWTTGAAVERNGRRPDGSFGAWIEELGTEPGEVDLARLNAGAPLLNAHAAWDLRDVIGVVEQASMASGRGLARVRFSDRDDVQPIARDVAGGILRNISVGYQVSAWRDVTTPGAETRRYRATSWQPLELSLVPIPADPAAQTRSQPPKGPVMDTQTAAPAATTAAVPAADDVTAERTRAAAIFQVCTSAGIPVADAQRYLSEGRSVEFVRQVAHEAAVIRSEASRITTGHYSVTGGYDAAEPGGMREAMAEGILARRRPDLVKLARGSRGEAYRAASDDDIVRELTGDRRATLRTVVLGSAVSRAHTSSDFPLLLENIGNKSLLAAYQQAVPSYRMLAAQRSFTDFRSHSFVRPGDFPAPLLNGESAEITYGTLSESKETASAMRYARRLSLSREILVNDGLGSLADPAAMAGRRVADLENSLVYAQLALNSGSGPTLRDTVAMCATSRGNKASSGTVIDITNVALARAAQRKITSIDGLKLNIAAKYLLCGPDKEVSALQLNEVTIPTQDVNANPFKGLMEVLVDANIAGNNWYLAGDPSQFPTLIWGYLEGYEGPRFEVMEAWTTDGVEFRSILYFGTGAIDWRGIFHNAGA